MEGDLASALRVLTAQLRVTDRSSEVVGSNLDHLLISTDGKTEAGRGQNQTNQESRLRCAPPRTKSKLEVR